MPGEMEVDMPGSLAGRTLSFHCSFNLLKLLNLYSRNCSEKNFCGAIQVFFADQPGPILQSLNSYNFYTHPHISAASLSYGYPLPK